MVAIRLTRMGAKKKSFYRVVAVDHERPRESSFIDLLGYYNPMKNPAVLQLDLEKYQGWIQKGAQPSETVRSLIKRFQKQP